MARGGTASPGRSPFLEDAVSASDTNFRGSSSEARRSARPARSGSTVHRSRPFVLAPFEMCVTSRRRRCEERGRGRGAQLPAQRRKVRCGCAAIDKRKRWALATDDDAVVCGHRALLPSCGRTSGPCQSPRAGRVWQRACKARTRTTLTTSEKASGRGTMAMGGCVARCLSAARTKGVPATRAKVQRKVRQPSTPTQTEQNSRRPQNACGPLMAILCKV
ncbi:hypothetical protein OH77DRAFT_1224306 [Trametes cingulata]|nr:hypothetical protein OH77DRAFT_1224306 [Trametes cingulata]